MKILKISVVLVPCVLLIGCASHWGQTRCQVGNMREQGIKDGRAGISSMNYIKYQRACDKFAVSLNGTEYTNGWKIGNKEYCTSEKVQNDVRNGKPYPNVCKKNDEQGVTYSPDMKF